MTHEEKVEVLRDLKLFRDAFVLAVGDQSPYAKEALKRCDNVRDEILRLEVSK